MRKVLSFVLVFTLVLSSFSMAFAADTTAGLTDITGNANEDAIQVNYDLGIVTGNPDGTFLPEKAVTRAEFAAMLTRALAIPDSALVGYTSTSFKDTTGYTWAVPYLAFCQSKGILLGDGAGNVMPGRTISVNEAMTMALRAIGYTANSSLLVGAWPANYVSIAQNSELYDDVSTKTTVDKANAAQIIYNLLTVQKVSVNTDGTTDLLWVDGDNDGDALNLLNSNLECTEIEDAILGATPGTTYDDAIINIVDDLGAHGTAYINDDDELIAFTKEDSIALTGEFNDEGTIDEFEVGDIVYDIDDADNDFGDSIDEDAYGFANGDADKTFAADEDFATRGSITIADMVAWASANSDDDTITINCDLSGKTITDVYSVVAWKNSDNDLADADVQEDIADLSLLDYDFVDDDNGNIDMNSFSLVGIASLDKIAEDDVIYVYTDKDDEIIKVAVGTETVEGVVDEIEETDDGKADTVTIGDKEYDVSVLATSDAKDIDVDSEGTFYIDAIGEIYDFDGTSGEADTFGIVEAWDTNEGADSAFDNPKVKLYLSDDSEKTFYFSESYGDADDDMDWVLKSDLIDRSSTAYDDIMNTVITKSALIGYSLDSSGDIDTVDVTSEIFDAGDVNFQSSKVLKITSGSATDSYSIDSACVVLTYQDDMYDTSEYDVTSLDSVESGDLASPAAVILNDDGDVVALFIDEFNADSDDNYVYGVINDKSIAKDAGGDEVSKFKGLIDGTEFSYKADDKYTAVAETFDIYAIEVDSDNVITDIVSLTEDSDFGEYESDDHSGWINATMEMVVALDDDDTVITVDSNKDGKKSAGDEKYTVGDDALVYEYDLEDDEYSVSKLSALDDNGDFYVRLFDTKGDDADGIATIVIFYEK